MKPSREAVERAARAIRYGVEPYASYVVKGMPDIYLALCRRVAEAALTAAMEHGERVWGGCDCLTNLDEKASYGLIRLED